MIPKSVIDEILSAALIEEVIGDFVQLKRAGSSLKGFSPFTDEKTPSFMVSPAKQIFKCFSTGKGGNVVSFLMEHEHFSYPEALKYLAQKYQIEIPEEREQTAEEIQALNEKESLYLLNNFAKDKFKEYLFDTDEGRSVGLSYFKERGFRDDIIEKFELGYCPEKGNAFSSDALEKGYQKKYLLLSGLSKEKNDLYDFYRGRIIFPIQSISGRVLGFGARTLKSDKNIAKYFNSPESPIYHKSHVLYGIFQGKTSIIKNDLCFLVEGYTDVISLYQNGVENVVSSSGTSLTKEQVSLIKRYTNNVAILFDGDAAGIKASFRGIDMFLEQGLNIKVVLFPEGEDPDSFAKSHSSEELQNFLNKNQQDFIRFKSEALLKDVGNDPIKKAEMIREMVNSIALIPDEITRALYIKEVALLFEMDEQSLLTELRKRRRQNSQKNPSHKEADSLPSTELNAALKDSPLVEDDTLDYESQELNIIRLLLLYGTTLLEFSSHNAAGETEKIESSVIEWVLHQLEVDEIEMTHPVCRKILTLFKDGILRNELLQESHFVHCDDQEVNKLTADILSSPFKISDQWAKKHYIFTATEEDKLVTTVENSMYSYKLRRIEEERNLLTKKLKSLSGENEYDLLLKEITILDEIKKSLSKKLGRIILK